MKQKLAVLILGILVLSGFKTKKDAPFTIYTIGDSTMANKTEKEYPETGWCQVIGDYFDDDVTISNHAKNGRSSRSFRGEGRWQAVLDSLQPGDYVFIQFGHNDQKYKSPDRYTNPYSGYRQNLTTYVNETREKGAHPILFTSIVRRNFNEYGTLIDTHTAYSEVARTVAKELDVPMIDLNLLTEDLVIKMGEEKSKSLYMWLDSCKNYPKGREDNTHLQPDGANAVAKLALHEIKKQALPLASHIKNIE